MNTVMNTMNIMRYIRNMQTIKNTKNAIISENYHHTRHYLPPHNEHTEHGENNFIKYKVSPSCVKCIHFLNDYPENVHLGKCKLFGEKNLVTGKINYQFAEICRANNNMCMSDGFYYKENPDNDLIIKLKGINESKDK